MLLKFYLQVVNWEENLLPKFPTSMLSEVWIECQGQIYTFHSIAPEYSQVVHTSLQVGISEFPTTHEGTISNNKGRSNQK